MSQYQKVVAYQPPTSATAPGMCRDTSGRPYWNPCRSVCVDAQGNSGFEPPPAIPAGCVYGSNFPECPLSGIRQSSSAARLCTTWGAYGCEMQPLLNKDVLAPGVVPGPVGYKVCDPYWGISVRGVPGKGEAPPVKNVMTWRRENNRNLPEEARRCTNTYKTVPEDTEKGPHGVVDEDLPRPKPFPIRRRVRASGKGIGKEIIGALAGAMLFIVLGVAILTVSGGPKKKSTKY